MYNWFVLANRRRGRIARTTLAVIVVLLNCCRVVLFPRSRSADAAFSLLFVLAVGVPRNRLTLQSAEEEMTRKNAWGAAPLVALLCFLLGTSSSSLAKEEEKEEGERTTSLSSSADASAWYTVYYNPTTKQYSVRPGRDTIGGVAWAEWADERFTTGWARFNLVGNTVYADDVQAMGAGYLEGYLR